MCDNTTDAAYALVERSNNTMKAILGIGMFVAWWVFTLVAVTS